MNRIPLTALSAIGLASAAFGAQQTSVSGPLQIVSPFERTADADGVATLSFDGGDYALLSHAYESDLVRLHNLPLPGGGAVSLTLDPQSAFEEGGKAVIVEADGSQSLLAPEVKCFFGFTDGGGTAFLAISPRTLQGYFSVGENVYFLSSEGDPRADRATLAHSSRVSSGNPAFSNFCDTAELDDPEGKFDRQVLDQHGQIALGTGSSIDEARLFVEADHQLRNHLGSDQATVDYVTLLTTFTSAIYRRDTGMRIVIPDGFLRVWNVIPPWGVVNDFGGLSPFRNYWSGNHPNSGLNRTLVHLLTRPAFGGVAYLDVACSNGSGYGLSSVNGSFPTPLDHTNSGNWDLVVYSHEMGHNYGSPHTFNYSPAIGCTDGSGPDSGTIMSYCHQNPGGINNVGLRFHRRVQVVLRSNIATEGCITSQNIQAGDYDGDSDVDFEDATVAAQVLNQGFESIAAEETFDMDGDGDFDQFDLDLLNAQISSGPATAVITNGSGVNEVCFIPNDNPLIGQDWNTQVLAFPTGTITVMLGYTAGTSGIFISLGELLIDPSSGFLFSSVSASEFLYATHTIAVPYDPAIIGAQATFQAFTATKACNAIDATVSFYE